jgi:hypothetical protein
MPALPSQAFLKRYEEVAPLAPGTELETAQQYKCLPSYLIELALQETDCLRWLPSMLAALALVEDAPPLDLPWQNPVTAPGFPGSA